MEKSYSKPFLNGLRKFRSLVIISVVCVMSVTGIVEAQEISIRTAIRGNNVYVYNVELPPPGQGFNIYRKGAGSDSLIKLNKRPVVSAAYPQEFRQILGNLYPQIQQALQTDNPTATMFHLRTDHTTGLLYTFIYPQVAKALGRLFIDSTATIGQKAHYKIVFVNDLDQPTGKTLEKDVVLKRQKLSPPNHLSARNKENVVTLNWRYPQSDVAHDDKIIRFNVYRSAGNDTTLQQLNGTQIIIRLNNKNNFEYRFVSSDVGRQVKYYVTAVSITGQQSRPSKPLVYKIKNNVPPEPVSSVRSANYQGKALVTWTANTAWDLMGYNVYRSRKINSGFRKVNRMLISDTLTAYIDKTVSVGKAYYYKVTAVDSANNESEKSTASVVYIKDSTPPPAAATLKAVYSDSNFVTLHWTSPPQSPDFKSWVLLQQKYQSPSDKIFNRMDSGKLRSNKYIDHGDAGRGFDEGRFYRFGIASIDSSGNISDTLMIVYQIPDHTPPDPPSYVTATNHDGVRVSLVWNGSSSGDTQLYKVYRMSVPGKADTTLLKTLSMDNRSFRDETIQKGHRYVYGISAVDSLHNESKPTMSDTVWVRDHVAPREVLHVRIDTSGSNATVVWEPVMAYDLAGYRVYRSRIQTGIFKSVTDSLIHKTRLTLPRSMIKGYWLRIRALDTSGNKSKPSEPVSLRKMSSY